MKKITKRITALIIAAIMIATMIPFAAAETETGDYKFEFGRTSHGLTSESSYHNVHQTSDSFTVENTATGYKKWGYINSLRGNQLRAYGTYLQYNFYNKYGYVFDPENDILPAFLALELVIDKPGVYTPKLDWTPYNSPYFEIYLIKAPTGEDKEAWEKKASSGAGNDNKCLKQLKGVKSLGLVHAQKEENGGDDSPKTLSQITIADGAEGNYYLVLVPNGVCDAVENTFTTDTSTCGIKLNSFSLTKVTDSQGITDAFKLDSKEVDEDYSEPAVITITKEGMDDIESEKNTDGTHNITAPATNKDGKNFLYWAKGLSAQKRILLGKTNKLENYVPDAECANYLIPVYEGEISGDEYYNANGQLIPNANQETRVSMPGYGTSTGWAKYGDNIYVATYELTKPQENINITVTGGTGSGTYAFGDVVTCTANGTGTFKYWKKNNEIVSSWATYSFKAWDACTVEAVYDEHVYFGDNMKIIIDGFDVDTGVTGVMAEFIGLGDAVEKGIMFTDSEENTTKIAMTTKDNQFTVIADEPGKYVGYAILKSGDVYDLITDGSYPTTEQE